MGVDEHRAGGSATGLGKLVVRGDAAIYQGLCARNVAAGQQHRWPQAQVAERAAGGRIEIRRGPAWRASLFAQLGLEPERERRGDGVALHRVGLSPCQRQALHLGAHGFAHPGRKGLELGRAEGRAQRQLHPQDLTGRDTALVLVILAHRHRVGVGGVDDQAYISGREMTPQARHLDPVARHRRLNRRRFSGCR